jgi:IS5 family transposase
MSSFFEIGVEERLKDNQLLRLSELVDWKKIARLLDKVHLRDESKSPGEKGYNKLSMFKALLLGQWHSLSDPKLEEALRVRLDFMRFTGFSLGEAIPDETTLCRFRNKLIAKNLDKKLFMEINKELERLGLKVEKAEAAVIDATIVSSVARPRKIIEMSIDREEELEVKTTGFEFEIIESADKDARWLKKGNKSYYGYKGFIATDAPEGYIIKPHVTPANRAEVSEFERFIEGIDSTRMLSDKGYASKDNRKILKSLGIKDGLMHKAAKGKVLKDSQKLFNRLVSKKRYIVEQAFGTLKRKFRFDRASYFGLRKVEAQLTFKAMCFNLNKALNIKTRILAV